MVAQGRRKQRQQGWVLETGARPTKSGGVDFRVWSPRSQSVEVATRSKSDWVLYPMQAEDDGLFHASLDGPDVGTRYMYVLDGQKRRPDPVSRYQPEGVLGPSQVTDPEAFSWTDEGWKGVARDDLLMYEVHTGTYTPAGTFESIRPHIRYLRERLGITALELMPVAQFPGERNWGYDGVYLYAVQNSYGGPDGLKALVDDCHANGLAVILDVVYNHLGPEGNFLADYGPYFSYKYRTPWGPAVNFDDRGSDWVRRFAVDNALFWVTEYHLDGLRLDAIHGIFDFSPKHILTEIADAVHAQQSKLGRNVHLIAESDLNDPRVISSKAVGGYDMDAQWSDDFHHSVHAYLTGERSRYYVDFGELGDIEKAIRDAFVYDGRFSKFRGMAHGAPATGIPGWKFVVCIQNHDQVGNRKDGSRLSTLLTPSQLLTAAGLLLLAPNVPLLFMGEEFGERAPFYYFISHGDPKLVQAVREGRKREFEEDGQIGGKFVDPQDRLTFERSKVDHSLLKRKQNLKVFQCYKALIAMRKAHPALRSLNRDWMEVRTIGRALGMRRWQPGVEELAAIYSLGEAAPAPEVFFPRGEWERIFDLDVSRPKGPFGLSVYRNAAAPRATERGVPPR